MRKHPIALGRGAKWWREQVRRNVSAIFDGLVRKGAKADRATMSRAYAFAIGSLVKHGYLKRTDKGLMVTDKGLAKSREKLRTVGARKRHEHFEKQLALVRKGPARRPANKRKTRRNPPEGTVIPPKSLAKAVAENEYGPLPRSPRPELAAALKSKGWTDDELALMDVAQMLVVNDDRLYETVMRRVRAEQIARMEGVRAREIEGRRPRLPAFLTAPIEEERTLTPLGERLRAQFGDDAEMRRTFGLLTPEEQEAMELERSIRRGITREVRGRRETYVYRMSEEMGPDSRKVWFLIVPQFIRRTGAQTKVSKMVNGVRLLRLRQIIEPELRRVMPDYDRFTEGEQIDAIRKYYKQYRAKVDDARQDEDGKQFTQVSAARLNLPEIKYGLALTALRPATGDYPRFPTQEEVEAQEDEAKRLFIVIHTRGGAIDRQKVPGGWEYVWHNKDAPYERVYKTASVAAGMNAIMQLKPQMIGIVNVLPQNVMRELFVRAGAVIGERAEGERQRTVAKRVASASRRRAQAEVMQTIGVGEFRMLDPEEQRSLAAAQLRRARGEPEPTRGPRRAPFTEQTAEETREAVRGRRVMPFAVEEDVTPVVPTTSRAAGRRAPTPPAPEPPTSSIVDDLIERLMRKNRRPTRR